MGLNKWLYPGSIEDMLFWSEHILEAAPVSTNYLPDKTHWEVKGH